MINTVTIVGNLGQDPEIRYTPNAVPVANFTIAVNEVYKGKDGQKVKKTHLNFRESTETIRTIRIEKATETGSRLPSCLCSIN